MWSRLVFITLNLGRQSVEDKQHNSKWKKYSKDDEKSTETLFTVAFRKSWWPSWWEIFGIVSCLRGSGQKKCKIAPKSQGQ